MIGILGHLFNGLVHGSLNVFRKRFLGDGDRAVRLGINQAPYSCQKTAHSLDAMGVPGFYLFKRAEKHLIQANGISAVIVQNLVGRDDVAPGFGHFLIVFTENHALVKQFPERLFC